MKTLLLFFPFSKKSRRSTHINQVLIEKVPNGFCTVSKRHSGRKEYQYHRHQSSPLLYSIEIWPARNSRLTERETNHYIAPCASVLAWCYLAGRLPEQLVIDHFAQHSDLLYVVRGWKKKK